MKMKLFFRISVLVLCILMSLSSFADDKKDRISVEEIDWSANNQSLKTIASTPDNPNKIYLYAKEHNKFVTVGGRYGAQPILAEVGMNFYVEKVAANDDRYYIHSWVNNPTTSQGTGNADYLGVEPLMDTDQRIEFTDSKGAPQKSIYLYVDRGINNTHDDGTNSSPDRIKWHITPVGTDNGYKIYSTWTDNLGGHNDDVERNYYLSYYQGPTEEGKPQKKFLVVTTDPDRAETFYFINIDNYHKVINSQTTKYINVSGLVQDARFERNNKGIDGTDDLKGDYGTTSSYNVWQFRYDRSDHAYVYPHLQDNVEELAYMTAWVGSEGSKEGKGNYLIQKITGLKPGLYRVNCQGFYFNPDNIDDKDNTSFVFASQNIDDISNQTALKTIEINDWYMMRDGTYNGSKTTDDGLNGFTDYSIKHCVNAGKIFAESNPYEDKDVDSRKYDSSVAVLVKADEGSKTGTGTLYIGAGKRANDGGYAFFDNFQLFYMGNKEWYLDATNTSTDEFKITMNGDGSYTPSGINHNNGTDPYNYPVTYNIRRYFHEGQWESLILPCTLTGDQVKQTFGGEQGVQLSAFKEVNGTCVYFQTVDLDNEGIVAGKPYIIKVGKEADIKTKGDKYTFPWGINQTVKVNGPIYQVKGVVPPTFKGNGVTTDVQTLDDYTVRFHGFYYDPGAAPAKAYVVNNGNMYHLTSAWNSFVGTSWYITITDAQGNAKALSFSFDGDSSTTAIENVTRQEDAAVQTDGFVYNLSGQRVGTRNNMSNLSSGIYVVAGKKVVVK